MRILRALRRRWDGCSLQYRITAGVGLGLGSILVLFGYIAFWSVDQVTDAALRERQQLAAIVAGHVEHRLDEVPAEASREALQQAIAPELSLPADSGPGRILLELFDGTGATVAISEQAPTYGDTSGGSRGGPATTATTASSATTATTKGSHAMLFADLMAAHRAGVRRHVPPSGGPAHIVVYQPLHPAGGRDGWGLMIEQRQDTLLALPNRMRLRMLAVGALALAAASWLAWLDARRVVEPLRRVTLAAQRIAGGDLTVPLASASAPRGDEVGQLTAALDIMRGRLVRSLAEIREWNQQLELRVRQRTEELAVAGEHRRQLLHKVIWAQEEERKRLARELHDETIQTLTGLAMTLQVIEDTLPPQLSRQRARLVWVKEQAVHAAREIRQLILGLRPSALDDLGLTAAVRWYAATHLEPLGVQVHVSATDAPALPPLVQTAAFRVMQETLANVARHAAARHVTIRMRTTPQALAAAIIDDGHGFDPAALQAARPTSTGARFGATEAGRGLGLLGMQERVALFGGRFAIRSAPGEGTRVVFSIPLAGTAALESAPDAQELTPAPASQLAAPIPRLVEVA